MLIDQLFEKALAYRKTKLWDHLYDSQLFAVKHTDGTIGYCCVMGNIGELLALAVYPGQKGLDSYRMLHDMDGKSLFDFHERMHGQYCAMVSFQNKAELNSWDLELVERCREQLGVQFRGKLSYPQFEIFRPGYERWMLEDEADQRHLLEALDAAIEVAERLKADRVSPEAIGFTDGAPFDREIPMLTKVATGYLWTRHPLPPKADPDYPTAKIEDDLTLKRLKEIRRKGQFAAKVFMHIDPVAEGEEDENGNVPNPVSAPRYPYSLMFVDVSKGLALSVYLANNQDEYGEEMIKQVVECFTEHGVPSKLLVEDARTKALLKPVCEQLSIKLITESAIPALDEILGDMLEAFTDSDEDWLDDEYDPDDPEDELSDEELDKALELFADPKFVRSLPNEILFKFAAQVDPDELPDDVVDAVWKELRRRRMV